MEDQSLLIDLEFNPVLASVGKRLLNYFIDVIIIFNFFNTFLLSVFFVYKKQKFPISLFSLAFLQILLISIIFWIILYFLQEMLFKGRTIGKFITGTKAVNKDGIRINAKTVLLRSLCRLIPFEPFSAFRGYPHPWHDKWTRTYVIDVKKTTLENPTYEQS